MGMLAAVKRAQCRTGWSAKAEGSGRRASGAGGAQEAELAHLRPLSEFNLD